MKNLFKILILSLFTFSFGQDCDENMFWSDCGLSFECNPTCLIPDPLDECIGLCEIGCFCNEGYIFSDDTYSECILIENCPEPSLCNENMYWSDCGLPFYCNSTCLNPDPLPECDDYCEIGCFCNEGYIFSDDSFNACTLIEECSEIDFLFLLCP